MICLKISKALLVRGALALHCVITVWRVTVNLDNSLFWLLVCGLLPLVIETFYTVVRRHGDEFHRFTPCFFLHLAATIPGVWLLELDKTDRYQDGTIDQLNMVMNSTSSNIADPLSLNPNTWTIIIEELLLYLLIVGRWILPRGEVSREQLSELLFAFISIASDIMEMFSLFAEDPVRNNKYMAYWILSVWSLSVLQFTMTFTVTHQPKRAKKIKVIVKERTRALENAKIRNELIAIVVSMLMQDVPFLTLRLYTIITYDLITYSLVFFTAKNALVISLLFYKIAVILQKRFCPEEKDEEEAEKLEVFERFGGGIIMHPHHENNDKFGGEHELDMLNYNGTGSKPGRPRDDTRASQGSLGSEVSNLKRRQGAEKNKTSKNKKEEKHSSKRVNDEETPPKAGDAKEYMDKNTQPKKSETQNPVVAVAEPDAVSEKCSENDKTDPLKPSPSPIPSVSSRKGGSVNSHKQNSPSSEGAAPDSDSIKGTMSLASESSHADPATVSLDSFGNNDENHNTERQNSMKELKSSKEPEDKLPQRPDADQSTSGPISNPAKAPAESKPKMDTLKPEDPDFKPFVTTIKVSK